MKQKTEQEALITLTALCASSEHCSQEMLDKMTRWQLPEEEQARVMEYLVKNNYIDEERFTHAFVMDKNIHHTTSCRPRGNGKIGSAWKTITCSLPRI